MQYARTVRAGPRLVVIGLAGSLACDDAVLGAHCGAGCRGGSIIGKLSKAKSSKANFPEMLSTIFAAKHVLAPPGSSVLYRRAHDDAIPDIARRRHGARRLLATQAWLRVLERECPSARDIGGRLAPT